MVERFVSFAGTISVANGASTVFGTGTTFGGRDRAGAKLYAYPASGAPIVVGAVAEVDPRGIYDNLELPLVKPFRGTTLSDVEYELVDGPAIANGATQAAIHARFAAFLEQNMGLAGNTADDIDYSLVPNNSLFVDAVTRKIYQWRNGVLSEVFTVGLAFNPRGAFNVSTTYAKNDLVEHDGAVFVANADATVGHTPDTSPEPASDIYWTLFPLPAPNDRFVFAPFAQGRPSTGELIHSTVFTDTIVFPAGLTGSQCKAMTAATAEAVFIFKKNGVAFGTATFAIAGTSATFVAASETTFTAGDRLDVVAPSPRDETLADIVTALRGTR